MIDEPNTTKMDHAAEAVRLARQAENDADANGHLKDSDRVRAVAGQIHALLAIEAQLKRVADAMEGIVSHNGSVPAVRVTMHGPSR